MRIRIFLMLAFIALIVSCAKPPQQAASKTAAAPEMMMKPVEAARDESTAGSDKPSAAAAAVERKLIKEGTISFKTKSIGETKAKLDGIVKETGSYYGSETQASGRDSLEVTCTVRIPADNFDRFLSLLQQHAGEIESKKIDTLDVTEEYMDLEARIRNKKELEQTFRELLTKARTIEEILQVEAQISNVREEIERSEGRLRYLSKSVALSTLTITYRQPVPAKSRYGEKLDKAFTGGWNFFVNLCIAFVYLWPLAALLLMIVLFVAITYRIRKRRNN